ncbi:hypothetical protein SteCoe_38994 [Stentor coeruleus]|uniref:Cilia-and flagella-associated protein 96 n=1 Tax=Stentor coeruleus TaxID=5963 RepID=A0A1R2AKW7_9CILI|nr:hypothetical protein SteCoe_38994 [Stentor coeruleus]
MSGSAMAKHEDIRKETFQQSKFDPMKSKFGVFSHPGFLATTEDTYARPLRNHRDSEGNVILGPKNFMVSTSKSNANGGCFSIPNYDCDLYEDPPRVYQIEKSRAERMYKANGSAWKHSGIHIDQQYPYNYAPDPIKSVKNHREPDYTVKTGPKSFFAAPAKKGYSTPGITIGKVPEHVSDPYESYENWLKSEKLKQKSKRLYGDFKSTSHGQKNFTDSRDLYKKGYDGKGWRKYDYDGANHQKPFMATCPIGFTIEKYPEHVTNTIREIPEGRKIDRPWKHTGILGSVPSRSVAKILYQDYMA